MAECMEYEESLRTHCDQGSLSTQIKRHVTKLDDYSVYLQKCVAVCLFLSPSSSFLSTNILVSRGNTDRVGIFARGQHTCVMLPHQATPVPFIAKPTVIGLGVIQMTRSLKSSDIISSRRTYQDTPQRGHCLLGNTYLIFLGVPMRVEIKYCLDKSSIRQDDFSPGNWT